MSLINKEVNDFKVQAYVGNDFKEGNGRCSFSIRLILPLYARLS